MRKKTKKAAIERRRKYGQGLTSEEFITTGIPRLERDPKPEPDYLGRNDANTRYAIRHFRPWVAKRKGPEYKIIFE